MSDERAKKILVCDDEKRIRRIYRNLLVGEGLEVIEAANAMDAREALLKEDISLVLLDINLPGVGGETVYDIIDAFHRDVKIIVSSVYHISEQKNIIDNAAAYHDKSQGTMILLKKIMEVLKNGTYRDNVCDL